MSWSQVDAVRWVVNHPLNRGHRAAALWRWVTSQLWAHLVPGSRLVPFVDDTRLYIGRGLTSANMQHYAGLGELDIMAFLMHFLRRDDVFVDVGANTGVMTVLAGGVAGASVVAFEPDKETFRWLECNVSVNGLESRVKAHAVAVSDRAGTMQLTKGFGASNRAARSADEQTQGVDCVTLDEILAGSRPTVLKIDVEGFETPVLHGAEGILRDEALKAVIIEMKDHGARYGFDENLIRGMMTERLGFKPFTYSGLERKLIALERCSRRPDNTIFIRDPDTAVQLVSAAPKRRLIWGQQV